MGNYLWTGLGPLLIPPSLCPAALRRLQNGYYDRGDMEELAKATTLAQGFAAFKYATYFAPDGGLVFVEQQFDLKDTWSRSLNNAFGALVGVTAPGSLVEVLDEGYGEDRWDSYFDEGISSASTALAYAAALAHLASVELAAGHEVLATRARDVSESARALSFEGLWSSIEDKGAIYEELELAEIDALHADMERHHAIARGAPDADLIIEAAHELSLEAMARIPNALRSDGTLERRLMRTAYRRSVEARAGSVERYLEVSTFAEVAAHYLVMTGNRVALPIGTINIGRTVMDPSQPWLLIRDAMTSRHHCRLIVTDERIFVEDVASTGGIYVNDGPRYASRELAHGDVVNVGGARLVLGWRYASRDQQLN